LEGCTDMEPEIRTCKETKLIGKRITTSFAHDKTVELWQRFAPRRKEIINSVNSDLYSVDVYHDTAFFRNFNPEKEFEKWAAVAVSDFDTLPHDMETMIIPEGQYAVFHYRGKPSESGETMQFIYGIWLPDSEYEMDDRPYFALMGEKYKGEGDDSEEDFWIPVKKG